jgi:hypothetical protein
MQLEILKKKGHMLEYQELGLEYRELGLEYRKVLGS